MDFTAQGLDKTLQMSMSVGNRSVLKEINKNDGDTKLSPLAVRSSPRHSMEQQKALIAAMRSPSQQPTATPTTPNISDGLKLTGLPEFDETQIPELAPLSADMDAQLKPNALNSTTVIKQEQDYNSDSDVYAECLSLNSGKFSADHSELDAYSSALNVLEHNQLSSATATTLENTFSEATASVHNDSCEPMDVDDINETMELLKDVLAPEDCKLLQQTCLGGAIKQSFNVKENEKEKNDEKEEQIREQELEAVSANVISPNLSIELAPQVEEDKEESMPQITTSISSPLPTACEPQAAAASPERPATPTMLPQSPPIPTHRTKTTEELEALKILAAYAEPTLTQEEEEEEEQPCANEGVPIASVEPIETAPHCATFGVSLAEASAHQRRTFNMLDTETGSEKRRATFGVSLEEASDHQRRTFNMADTVSLAEASDHKGRTFNMFDAVEASRRTLTLDTNHTLAERGESAPTSPTTTFPMKSSAAMSPSQFPRSPHAPPEEHEMPYLEKAAIESTAENKVCLSGGVIAISPLPIEINVTKASPEQHKEQDEEETPLNGTYATMSTDTVSGKRHSTYGSQASLPLENSYASPALEATEENIVSDELEPMDVDVSMRVETTLLAGKESSPSPLECPGQIQSPSLPAQQQQQHTEQLHHPKPLRASPPLPTGQLKRPSIHKDVAAALQPTCPNATVVLEEPQTLSAKEQLSVSDEKDVYVDHFGAMSPITDDIFKPPQYTSSTFNSMAKRNTIGAANAALAAAQEQFDNSEFQDGASNNNIILNSSDIDYLFTKGCSSAAIARSSLLLKFDPLLGTPVPENHHTQQEQALLNILGNNNNNNNNLIQRALSPTLEEHETSGGSNRAEEITQKHAKMSVDVIDNDCNKTFDNSNLNSEEKTHKYHNMDELEKKIKNEVTRSEDIENKLREAEQREEALVKRITEKDKNNAKLNSVIEAYEKAIAELIHDKEQLVQNHERQMAEVQADRDSNYTHLMSLETTFSDLHIKYEKSKEMTSHLRQIEETLLDEKKQIMDKLRQQEQRYEQMKSHAMQQMEIANRKLCTLTKEHTDEVKKLKALLKKEEVARIATTEQIQQKARENADLLKICEELIYDKGQSGTS